VIIQILAYTFLDSSLVIEVQSTRPGNPERGMQFVSRSVLPIGWAMKPDDLQDLLALVGRSVEALAYAEDPPVPASD
jgi:hypothetical protein